MLQHALQVNMLEAKSQLSKLVKAAMAGDDVIIASHGKPQVRLVPCASSKGLVAGGSLGSRYQGSAAEIAAAFTDAVDQEVAHLAALFVDLLGRMKTNDVAPYLCF